MRIIYGDEAVSAEAIRTPEGAWYSDPTIISPMFKGVVGTNSSAEQADQMIDAALAYFRRRGKPLAFWWVGPSARPADMGAQLLAHGFAPFEIDAPSMGVGLHTLPERIATPEGFTIESVRDAEGAQARVIADCRLSSTITRSAAHCRLECV